MQLDTRGFHQLRGLGLAEQGAHTSRAFPDWASLASAVVRRLLLQDLAGTGPSSELYLDEVVEHEHDRVHRHTRRGRDTATPKEVRQQEDREAKAGMRDLARLQATWPEFWRTMAPIAAAIIEARDADTRLQGLVGCLGGAPSKEEPPDDAIARLRQRLAEVLGIPAQTAEQRHQFSPWRHRFVEAVQAASSDPDGCLAPWLRDGAPMGIKASIGTGGVFPLSETPRTKRPEEVIGQPPPSHSKSRQLP